MTRKQNLEYIRLPQQRNFTLNFYIQNVYLHYSVINIYMCVCVCVCQYRLAWFETN